MSPAAPRDASEPLRICCVSRPFLVEERSGKSSYTHLFACISEEDDGYTVRVRLCNQANQQNSAHGEEIADTLETASMLIAALAAEFSIPQACIKIEILMQKNDRRHAALAPVCFPPERRKRGNKSGAVMALSFPNPNRSYDATRRAVRFWGHDSVMEASFFITEDALKRVQPDMRLDEAGLLGAFDAHRHLIYTVAAKVYVRGRKGSYDLVSSDF